jgi:hypothetical protein
VDKLSTVVHAVVHAWTVYAVYVLNLWVNAVYVPFERIYAVYIHKKNWMPYTYILKINAVYACQYYLMPYTYSPQLSLVNTKVGAATGIFL